MRHIVAPASFLVAGSLASRELNVLTDTYLLLTT